MSRVSDNLSESQVVKVWQRQLLDRAGLATEDGEPIEIIYPGRLNDEQGADFRDAVITTGKGLARGDVEVHVRSSGWQEHRHHRDAVYNRVILHVVMWHNARTATRLQNGREVPTLALHRYIKYPPGQWPDLASSSATANLPCFKLGRHFSTSSLAGFLDRAGEERFSAKAAVFQRDLARMEAGQCLYQGIMVALGYSKNKLPFLELASRLPLQMLESMAQDKISDEEWLVRQQALLLGTAGLLPTQRRDSSLGNKLEDKWTEELERRWTSSGHARAMSPDAWNLFKVRPNNSPPRRLVAMSYLLLRYRAEGLLKGLVSLLREAPVSRGYPGLKKGLVVTTDGRGTSLFETALANRIRIRTLLGSGRAAEIIVNVLLPFTFAWGQSTSQPELASQALNLYRFYPRLAVNSVAKHMAEQLGLSGSLVNSARRQQGLIHIYNNLCTQGRCGNCSLSQSEVGNRVQVQAVYPAGLEAKVATGSHHGGSPPLT